MAVSLTTPPALGAAVPTAAAWPGSAGAASAGAVTVEGASFGEAVISPTGTALAPNSTATATAPATARVNTSRARFASGAGAASPAASRVTLAGGFSWPLSPQPEVIRWFEPPASQWSAGHRGVDLRAVVDQSVLSAGAGVVAFSGVIAGRGVITVRHSGGLRTTYEPLEERLSVGTVVHRGTPLGVVSSTPGHCVPDACLHWGAISGPSYRDPLSLLGFGRPILLPLD
jgi:murein DD-endopeptidase MepM/ murein hydrolase activator NlpD